MINTGLYPSNYEIETKKPHDLSCILFSLLESKSYGTLLNLISKENVSLNIVIEDKPLWVLILNALYKKNEIAVGYLDFPSSEIIELSELVKDHILHEDYDLNFLEISSKTILDIVIEFDKNDLAQILISKGKKISKNNELSKRFVNNLYSNFQSIFISNADNVQLHKSLIALQHPPVVFDNGNSLILDIMHKGTIELQDYCRAELKLTSKKLQQIEELSDCLKFLSKSLDLVEAKEQLMRLTTCMQAMEEFPSEAFYTLASHLDAVQERLSLREKNATTKLASLQPIINIDEIKTKKKPRKFSIDSCFDYEVKNDTVALCIKEKKYSLLPCILYHFNHEFNKLYDVDKAIFHAAFDKCIPLITSKTHPYTGGVVDNHVYLILESLSHAFSDKKLSLFAHEDRIFLQKIIDEIHQSFALILYAENQENPSKKLLSIFLEPSTSFPLLLHGGYNHHAVIVSIRKNINGMASLTLYNTGAGVAQFHPSFPGEKRLFQTFLAYDDIPLENITENFIKTILDSPKNQHIEPLYDIFHLVGRTGKLVPPSTFKQHYEQKQMQGTCSYQCLASAMRHLIFSMAGDSAWHALGLYKMFKMRKIEYIISSRLDKLDLELHSLAQTKLKKQTLELKLTTIAAQEDEWHACQHAIYSMLSRIGENDFIANMRLCPIKTSWERFAVMRTTIRFLSYTIADCYELTKLDCFRQQINVNLDAILSLVNMLAKEKKEASRHINKLLDNLYSFDKPNLVETLYKFLLSKTHYKTVLNWIIDEVIKDTNFLLNLPSCSRLKTLISFLKDDFRIIGVSVDFP